MYTQIVRRSVSVGFCPLNPPRVGDFETGVLAQSPPLVGDLGGEDLGDDGLEDLCVHSSLLKGEGTRSLAPFSLGRRVGEGFAPLREEGNSHFLSLKSFIKHFQRYS